MKIEYLTDDNFIIHLNKCYLKDLNIKDKNSIELYFKKLFFKLKNNRRLNIQGYYHVKVYHNIQYGLIIDVNKLSNEYFNFYNNKVDMKITIDSHQPFLYEIEDYFIIEKLKDKIKNIYYFYNKYYIELNDIIDDHLYNFLLENSNIIYNSEHINDILSLCCKL